MQKRDHATAPLSLVLLAAVGFSFLASTGWELFEFTFEQIACKSAAAINDIYKAGDAQHWSYTIAENTAKVETLFNPYFRERWAIMDTMGDIILNTVGAMIAIIAIRIYPTDTRADSRWISPPPRQRKRRPQVSEHNRINAPCRANGKVRYFYSAGA